MDLKQIQELISHIAESGVSEVRIEQEGFKITIKGKAEEKTYAAPMQFSAAAAPVSAPAAQVAAAPAASPAPAAPAPANDAHLLTIKSPMIGTFYRAAGPDKPLFVNVGDEVGPGKTVCIIEAMKLFNEIESDVKGRIVKILVENSSPVEYDQPLFLVDPS